MTKENNDPQESEILQLAIQALNSAQRRALEAGRTVVIVDNDALVQRGANGDKILKKLPPRRKVSDRVKRAKK